MLSFVVFGHFFYDVLWYVSGVLTSFYTIFWTIINYDEKLYLSRISANYLVLKTKYRILNNSGKKAKLIKINYLYFRSFLRAADVSC